MPRFAVDLNAALMGLYDGLCQRQTEAHALGILGKSTSVKAFEDMVQVLRVDAAAAVLHGNRGEAWGLLPPDLDAIPLCCVVQGILDKVSDSLRQLYPVAKEDTPLIPRQDKLLSFLPGPEGILSFDLPQQLREVLR